MPDAASEMKTAPSGHSAQGVTIGMIEVFPMRVPGLADFAFAGGMLCKAGGTTPHIYVRITDSEGAQGWGEGRPCPGWSAETFEGVTTTLRHYITPALVGHPVHDRFGLHAKLDRVLGGHPTGQPIARSAIDVALHDLLARRANMPLRAFLGGAATPARVALSYTLTDHTAEKAGQTVAEKRAAGYKHFNFKAGVASAEDVAIAARVREIAGTEAHVWADANQSLRLSQARQLVRALEAVGVDLLEQPLAGDAQHAMVQLRQSTTLPLGLDEGCVSATDYYRHVALGAVDYLIIKLNRSGGIWPSLQQIGVALAARQGLVLSGLCETLLMRAAGAQVAAAFGVDGPAALNGGQFLDETSLYPEKQLTERDGSIYLDERPGIGVEPDFHAVQELVVRDAF